MSLPSTVDVSRASSGRDERDVGDACVLDTSKVQSTRRCKASFNMLDLPAGYLVDESGKNSFGGVYVQVLSVPPCSDCESSNRLLPIRSDRRLRMPRQTVRNDVTSSLC